MDDLMKKLNDVLNDEESMKQISELAASLGGGENSDTAADTDSAFPDIDVAALLKLKGAAEQAAKSDKNVALLLALKPLLKEDKQQRVDRAIKLLRLASLMPLIKDSGLLGGDLFGVL